jgi:hypothetical protein
MMTDEQYKQMKIEALKLLSACKDAGAINDLELDMLMNFLAESSSYRTSYQECFHEMKLLLAGRR